MVAVMEERFDMMVSILGILEKKSDPEISESVLEIIDTYDNRLTPEQKAKLLDNFLKYRNGSKHSTDNEDHKARMEQALQREQTRRIQEPNFSVY